MASYRIYYCDPSGKAFSADDIEAPSDEDAIARADALAKNHTVPFEVWQHDRLVHRQAVDAAMSGNKPPPAGQFPRRSS
jgi:hypothetical protein